MIEIKHEYTGSILYTSQATTLKVALVEAVEESAYSSIQDTYGQSVCVSADCFGLGE
jgi:hypothetical protein